MNCATRRIIVYEGREIQYHLEQKAVKNLNLRVKKDGTVYVSAHTSVPHEEIDQFVFGKAAYVLNAINKFEEMAQYRPQPKRYVSGETFYIQGRALRLQVSKSPKESIQSDGIHLCLAVKDPDGFKRKQHIVKRYLDTQCKSVFGEVIDELYPTLQKYGVAKPILRIRDMETRWGSCLPKKGVITLNKQLLEAPRNCIEYVVMHELCHFLHPNHSKHFYTFLTMLMPDWKERKEFLNKTATYWL